MPCELSYPSGLFVVGLLLMTLMAAREGKTSSPRPSERSFAAFNLSTAPEGQR